MGRTLYSCPRAWTVALGSDMKDAKMGSIKDRNGMDLTEAEDIKKRWQEYTEELYPPLVPEPASSFLSLLLPVQDDKSPHHCPWETPHLSRLH